MSTANLEYLIKSTDNIVFFGGAGVSTESGIPDFRSKEGLFNKQYKYSPETILSKSFFNNKTKDFYDFYRDRMIFLDAKPSIAHNFLSELENKGKLKAIITQNIDGLHQLAGSNNVIELHGSIHRNNCMKCKKIYEIDVIIENEGIPYCDCGGIIKPDVVLYEEALDNSVIDKAINYITKADVLIVGGTSLSVYPAAGLINYYKGNKLVLINKTPTPMDSKANFIFNASMGEVLKEVNL